MAFGLGDALGVGLSLLGGGDGGGGGAGDLIDGLLGSGGGDIGGLVSSVLGSDGGGASGLLDNLLGSGGGDIGGLVDSFAGSSGLGDLVGGLMGGDGVASTVTNLIGGSDAGSAVIGLLGNSGLASGVGDVLGGQGEGPGGWLDGLTESLGVGSFSGITSSIGGAAGGDFGGIGDLAESLGEAVGADLGGLATTVGDALSDDGGGWFNTLDNVLDGAGDAFGSPGGILSSVAELTGTGPNWMSDITSTVETLGSTGFSGALDLIDETVGSGGLLGDSSPFSDAVDFIQDSVTAGGGLGELDDWGSLVSEGVGALGLDLPEMGGSSLLESVESIVPESPVDDANRAFDDISDVVGDVLTSGEGAVEFIEELSSSDAGALLDQIVGSDGGSDALDALDGDAAKALLSRLATGGETEQADDDLPSWATEPIAGLSSDSAAADTGVADAGIEVSGAAGAVDDLDKGSDLGSVDDFGGVPEVDVAMEPEPDLGALDDAVQAADELESSVDDLFEGL